MIRPESLVREPESLQIQADHPVAAIGEEAGVMPPGERRSPESMDEHYCVSGRLRVVLFYIHRGSVDVQKAAFLTDQAFGGHTGLSLAEGYQIGNDEEKDNQNQHYVGDDSPPAAPQP